MKFSKVLSIALVMGVSFLISCQDEDRLTLSDTLDITEDALTESYYQDMDDMGNLAVETPSDNDFSGGRTSGTITINDDRFDCNDVEVTLTVDETSTVQDPKGVITIDFGTVGCADVKGNVRTGKLIITYTGRRFQVGSKAVLTTDNYAVNGVKLEGTRTLTNVTGTSETTPKFNVTLVNGKATFPDGKIATRESDFTWSLARGLVPVLTIFQGGSASGTTRNGRTYEVEILEDLKYQRFCGIATDGIKKYVIDGTKEISIDYGDGTCDNSVTVTINGSSRSLTIND